MLIRKKRPAYKGDLEERDFILLWVEENIGVKRTPATQPYFFEPTRKELKEETIKNCLTMLAIICVLSIMSQVYILKRTLKIERKLKNLVTNCYIRNR